jgi:hypothetical protein
MESIQLAKMLEGINTLEMASKKLKVKKSTAIKIISKLRKEGFVETSGGGKQPRLYKISPIRTAGKERIGLYDVINKHSKVKIAEPFEHKVVDRNFGIERVLPLAVKIGEFRLVLASLGLFNLIKDWHNLCYYSKKYDVMRKIGALYDVARTCIRTRRMDERTRKALLNGKDKKKFIVKPLKSEDFKEIENKWKVYVPFNKSDLMRYKE